MEQQFVVYQRGERQTARTKRAIIEGLIALLREKNLSMTFGINQRFDHEFDSG